MPLQDILIIGLLNNKKRGGLGPELWTYPPYVYNGTEANAQIVESANILVVGRTYRTSLTEIGPNTGGTTRALIGNQVLVGAENDTVTSDLIPATTLARWQALGTPPFEGTVTLSIKEVIN